MGKNKVTIFQLKKTLTIKKNLIWLYISIKPIERSVEN